MKKSARGKPAELVGPISPVEVWMVCGNLRGAVDGGWHIEGVQGERDGAWFVDQKLALISSEGELWVVLESHLALVK